jgi:hypothetical protein
MVCLNFLVGAKPAGEIHLLVSCRFSGWIEVES